MTYSITIPMNIKKRGGRKMIIVPDTPQHQEITPQAHSTLFKALIKAHWFQKEMHSGKYLNLKEFAVKKQLHPQYVRQIFQLIFLSPKIKEAIIHGKHPRHLKLQDIMKDIPISWEEQEKRWEF